MAIDQTISAIPLLRHRDTVVSIADQNDFVEKYEINSDHLSNNTVTELNVFATEANILQEYVNDKEREVSHNVVVMSGYVATTKEYRDETLGYKNATETLYNDTVDLLEDVDIGGTAGYTTDAVDDMFTRQRNSQFVGLT